MSLRFNKSERLCSRKLIDHLYTTGHRLMVFPFSVCWQEEALEVPCQVLITTSKRRFRHAVDRNRVKRLTRECYRHQLPRLKEFLTMHGVSIALSINYIHTQLPDYDRLQRKFDKLMVALEESIKEERERV